VPKVLRVPPGMQAYLPSYCSCQVARSRLLNPTRPPELPAASAAAPLAGYYCNNAAFINQTCPRPASDIAEPDEYSGPAPVPVRSIGSGGRPSALPRKLQLCWPKLP